MYILFLLSLASFAVQGAQESGEAGSESAPMELSKLPDAPVPEAWSTPAQEPSYEENSFRGNWFKKRELVHEARTVYEGIQEYLAQTWEPSLQEFSKQYTGVPADMLKSIQKLGLSKQDIETAQTRLQQDLALVTEGKALADKRRVFSKEQYAIFEEKIKTLKESYLFLEELRALCESAIQKAQSEAPQGAEQEQRAWRLYEEIDAAYNDKQAALLLAQMKEGRVYLEQLLLYVHQQLASYCNQLVTRFNQEVALLEGKVRELEDQGVSIRPAKVLAEKAEKPSEKTLGWSGYILEWLKAPFRWITAMTSKLFHR